MSGAATFCGSTKVDVRGEVHGEVKKTRQGSIQSAMHGGRADYQISGSTGNSRQHRSSVRYLLIRAEQIGR
jgi:hypothetical protein